MVIRFLSQREHINPTNVRPSTRDLAQFVSPNPNEQTTFLSFTETTGNALADHEAQFEAWEDSEPGALIINTQSCIPNTETYLEKLIETVTCPIIREQNIAEKQDLYEARLFGFDGQITSFGTLDTKAAKDLADAADSMNFRLIFSISNAEEWEKVLAMNPRFVHVAATVGELPPVINESNIWLIGPKAIEQAGLKCAITEVPHAG